MEPEPKETRVSARDPQVALKEDACMDARGDEASIMTVWVRQPILNFFWKSGGRILCSVAE